MTTHDDVFIAIKRRLWSLVGGVEISEAEADELCRLVRARARGAETDARDREAALAVDQRWSQPRSEG